MCWNVARTNNIAGACYWKFESLMSGYAHAALRSITCPMGLIDYENKIIGNGTAMYIILRLIAEVILWLWKRIGVVPLLRVTFTVHLLKQRSQCRLHLKNAESMYFWLTLWTCPKENEFRQLLTFPFVNKEHKSCENGMVNCFSANLYSGEFGIKRTKPHVLRSNCYIWKYMFLLEIKSGIWESFPSTTFPVSISLSSWVIPCLLPLCTG